MASVFDDLLSAFRSFLEGFDREQVRGFATDIDWSMPPRALTSNTLACLTHLGRAADIASPDARPLAGLLDRRREAFRWGQTYTAADLGRHFIDNYGWLEVFGRRGYFANERLAGGILLLGPGIVYPDHHHEAEEIYIPLTGGTEWRMGDGPYIKRDAGELVHHASNVNHAMRTGEEPLLALYLWRGGPLAARSTVTGTVTQGRG